MLRLQKKGAIGYPEVGNVYIEDFLKSESLRLVVATKPPDWPVYLYELH